MDSALNPKIIFEDTHLVVLDKPAGLLSQGDSSGEVNLVDYLRGYFGRNYVGLVHRLDRNTSGIMVVAKRSKSADRLTQTLQNGSLKRSYIALVTGSLMGQGKWKHHLLKDEVNNLTRVVSAGTTGSKEASLNYKYIQTFKHDSNPFTLVEFELESGRSHQIRAQAQAMGHTLLGDVKYGFKPAGSINFNRPALHSHRIEFPHPMSQEIIKFEAEIPSDFKAVLNRS